MVGDINPVFVQIKPPGNSEKEAPIHYQAPIISSNLLVARIFQALLYIHAINISLTYIV